MDYDRRYLTTRVTRNTFICIDNNLDVTFSTFFQEKGYSKFEIYLVFDDNLEVNTPYDTPSLYHNDIIKI